jgi:exopolysaccharide biosynthesis polyprenyl glycosylphosphotransferase
MGSAAGSGMPAGGAATGLAGWGGRYLRSVVAADATAALVAGVIALEVRFGGRPPTASYLWFTFGLPAVWVTCVALAGGYEPRLVGEGADEFRRVINAGVSLTAAIAIVSYLMKADLSRGYVFVAMPTALVLDLTARYWLRKRLHRVRAGGGCMRRAVAVGHRRDVAGLIRMLRAERYHGLSVVAACLAGQQGATQVAGAPVYGGLDDIVAAVRDTDADTVAILACPEVNGTQLRRLAWSLEKTGTELCVAPALLDIAGPRTSIRAVAGLPLLHVDHPSLGGARQAAKTVFDKLVATSALLLLAPLMLAIALAVRLEDGGPALSRQLRVGRGGRPFHRYAFRTAAVDAGRFRSAALTSRKRARPAPRPTGEDAGLTRTGGWLCRWSLQALPQLVNVLAGQMSLVGPRPAGPREQMRYSDYMRWRLDVRPGLTGPWVVRGLVSPAPEEAIRLDLRYLENWSFALDLQILWKTWSAVIRGRYPQVSGSKQAGVRARAGELPPAESPATRPGCIEKDHSRSSAT